MIKDSIQKLKNKINLSTLEIEDCFQEIMSGKAQKQEIAQFLLDLREKGATVEEITGAAKIMRKFAIKIETNKEIVLDTCGTGGDKLGTFNISTISALVVAGCGVTVAKHGNRSASSRCGSADVLEALGVNLNMDVSYLKDCLNNIGIAFLFAQNLHPAMKYAAAVRKELAVETIFNILGPLTNPASATHQMMGVYDKNLVNSLVYVLKNLGLKRALVVHGSDGLDEVTTTGISFASEFKDGNVNSFSINPQDCGIKIVDISQIKGSDLSTNTQILKDILGGQRGPKRDIVVLNAGCALYVAEKAKNIPDGIKLAKESIDSGAALKKLEQLRDYSLKK
ncbi:MAG: anthranilate phosphoribosyltransferase [Candidatus Omnitrophota bacterium]|nr:anthranilate phosphoribosyltransferase [Candidatus Omnitrophota bacterium]